MNPVESVVAMVTGKSRKQKPWQRPSDATPRGRPLYAHVAASKWRGGGKVCARHKVAVKRVRRRIDGVNRKVTICPRCEREAA